MSDGDMMTAAIAMGIRQDFAGLLSRPARLLDMAGEIRETAAPAAAETMQPAAAVTAAQPIGAMAGRTPAAGRQAARRATIRPAVGRQPVAAADLF